VIEGTGCVGVGYWEKYFPMGGGVFVVWEVGIWADFGVFGVIMGMGSEKNVPDYVFTIRFEFLCK
jgi:hypothetical protein